MNDVETAAKLRQIMLEAEAVVGSVSVSNYQAMLTIALSDPQTWAEKGSVIVSENLTKLDAASTFLDGEFVSGLKKEGLQLPPNLWELSQRASAQIKDFAKLLRATIAAAKPYAPSKDQLAELESNYTEHTSSVIEEFLQGFTDLVVSKVTKSQKAERRLITTAIAQIDHISTSINMISVNASVEAARAGEFGKSFAVIAAEIQTLSSQSRQAIQKIRQDL